MMSEAALPMLYLARHGETAWSRSGQHTGRSDLPLTPNGEAAARTLAERLKGVSFAKVFTSPLIRARHTAELAGYGTAELDSDLLEWDYGQYEGLTTVEIKKTAPHWDLFTEGVPGGETPQQIATRADRVVARARASSGAVLVFSSAHFLRVLTARWCGLDVYFARYLLLDTGSVSILGYAHNRMDEPAIKQWNHTH
jgi:broad specificity phosphatase PhoE